MSHEVKIARIALSRVSAACALFLLLSLGAAEASAGVFEVSLGFSFSQSNYSDDSFSWNRRWGASFGYHLSERSEIELSYTDSFDRKKITGYEDTSFHDTIMGASWVQALTGKDFALQPYFKLGVGQLNREASGTYFGSISPPKIVDSVSVILGAGLRLYITRTIGLKGEATTYLAGGSVRTWKDDFAFTSALSVYF